MDKRLILFAVFIAAFSVFALSRFRTRDISRDVTRAEEAVFSVLRTHDITDADILFREEKEWKRGGTRGKTLTYVLKADGAFAVSGLPEQIKKALRKVKGAHCDGISYHSDGAKTGTARFDITRRHEVILSVTIKNVLASWIGSRKAEIRRADKRIPAVPDGRTPVVALVLDDFGYTKKNLDALKEVGVPLTIAVLPGVPYSGAVCSFAEKNGLEVILHLPMEPEGKTGSLEKDTISGDMEDADVKEILGNAFRSVYAAVGVSNHMGSKATKDPRLMTVVFEDLKERGMFFLDSFTTQESACAQAAQRVGIPCAERDVFIDNRLEPEYIKRQMEELERIAFARGSAVAIGHDRGVTIDVLRAVVPKMKENGLRFVALSEIIEGKR